ncbi:TIGR02186 family protein [Primorskyibacter flagellatus]|uniref:TIGR02186 family protein n=1 Tax=Primorskyibacter flagellatus TaxID=1387277 RepID=UPI003A8CDA09
MMRWLFLLVLMALPAWAEEEVVLGLSHDRVSITADFNGSEILIFGAIKRETKIPEGPPLQVIVSLAGPSREETVRRKERRFGIWVNTESVVVDAAPSFYAVATSAPWREAITQTEDLRYRVSIPRAIRSVGAPMSVMNAQAFSDAIIRIRKENGLYQLLENTVAVDQQTLFRTSIKMPANLTEGAYEARIFLTREGRVINQFDTVIDVQKVGLERWLFSLSRSNPMAYGLLSLTIAILAGWGASTAFRMLRNG